MRKTSKIKDFDNAGKFGDKDNRKKLSERLNYLKDNYEDKKITANEIYNRVKANGGNVSNPDTINKWLQGRIFPTEENLIALAKTFPPYSSDYFRGLTPEPDYNYEYITKETGLSWKAIEHLKKLSKNRVNRNILNDILESSYFDDLVESIKDSQHREHDILSYENVVIDSIKKIIDSYDDDITEKKINDLIQETQEKLERISVDNINKPFKGGTIPAYEIAVKKYSTQESFSAFFNSVVPKLKSLHYIDLKDIFDKFIKPIESFETYSEEYYIKVLFPLLDILKEKKPQYLKDTEEGIVSDNIETQKKLSDLYEIAQKIIETSGNTEPEKPTKKKSKRKKV